MPEKLPSSFEMARSRDWVIDGPEIDLIRAQAAKQLFGSQIMKLSHCVTCLLVANSFTDAAF